MLQTRLERATYGLGNRCSILLSYWSDVPNDNKNILNVKLIGRHFKTHYDQQGVFSEKTFLYTKQSIMV